MHVFIWQIFTLLSVLIFYGWKAAIVAVFLLFYIFASVRQECRSVGLAVAELLGYKNEDSKT